MLRKTLLCLALLASTSTFAQTAVKDGWVRGTMPQQKATGAFMTLTSPQGGKLVAAASPVAGVVEIHEMAMEGNVMKMRSVPALALPAGQPVELKPGGFHVMLLDLKKPLPAGDSVPLTLTVQSADGKTETLQLTLPVKPLATPASGGPGAGHDHKH